MGTELCSIDYSTTDEPVEGSIIEAPNALSDEDIQNAMTSASPPSRFQTKKTLCQQQERKMFLENEGDTSQQLPCISQQLFQDSTEQDEQVLEIKKRTPNTHSYEEICTAAASKRTPECVEHIIGLSLNLFVCPDIFQLSLVLYMGLH